MADGISKGVFVVGLVIEFLVLVILLWPIPGVSATQVDIGPVADSYTSSISPNTNYGRSEFLDSYYYTYGMPNQTFTQTAVTWLKFDLSVIPSDAAIDSAILRLHTTAFGPTATNKIGAFVCHDSDWQEMTINWNNTRVLELQTTGAPLSTLFVSRGDRDYDFNVTSAVKSQNTVTFVLKTIEPTGPMGGASFYSKEKQETHYRPRLDVEYSSESSFSRALDSVLWLIIFMAIVAVVIVTAYFVIRRKQRSPMTPMRRRGLVRILSQNQPVQQQPFPQPTRRLTF